MAQRKRKRRKGSPGGSNAQARRQDGTKVGLVVFAVIIIAVFVVALYAMIAGNDPLAAAR